MNGRSSWTWAGPGLVGILILFPAIQFGDAWPWWVSGAAWAAAFVFLGWGSLNLLLYGAESIVWIWRDFLDTSARNGLKGLLEVIAQLRPDQVQLADRWTGGAIRVRKAADAASGPRYIVDGADVPIEFLKFVLDRSDDQYLCAQREFNDKAYNWDPLRKKTDRELYMMLLTWLFAVSMVEWPRGNQAAKWKDAWSPKKVAELFDLEAFTYGQAGAEPIALQELSEVMSQQGSGLPVRPVMR